MSGKGFAHITEVLSQVETLQLRKLPGLTDSVMVCCNVGDLLTHLDLRESEAVTDVGLMAVLKRCPNISILNIAYLCQLTNKSLLAVASCLGKNLVGQILSSLVLKYCTTGQTFLMVYNEKISYVVS